jgi:hypothetical protein
MPYSAVDISDIQRDYRRTIALAERDGEKLPVYIADIRGDSGSADLKVTLHYSNKEEWGEVRLESWNDLLKRVDFTFPRLGYVNLKDVCVLLSRYPKRQWNVPFSESSVGLGVPAGDVLVRLGKKLDYYIGDCKIVHPAFMGGNYVSVGEALDGIFKGDRISTAISRNFAIATSLVSKYPALYRRKALVGLVKSADTVSIFPQYIIWKEALSRKFANVEIMA